MKEEEKQRKFHEALLKMLYPPPSPRREAKQVENKLIEPSNDHPTGEELENEERYSSTSSDDDDDDDTEGENGGNEKLTRAQRKRLRKRKLKEGACQRRKIIGPLLPDSSDPDKDDQVAGDVPETGRQNASTNVSSGEVASSSKRNKLRRRRKSNKNLSGKS